MPRKRRRPAALGMPPTGDHGTGTAAATAGTRLRPVEGQEHNRTHRREHVMQLDEMHRAAQISQRQWQAGKEIEAAYCQVQKLSSGGPLREQVDTSSRPDAVVAIQVDAQSRLHRAMAGVPRAMRPVVEHVCWHNRPLSEARPEWANAEANLKVALDLAANKLGY